MKLKEKLEKAEGKTMGPVEKLTADILKFLLEKDAPLAITIRAMSSARAELMWLTEAEPLSQCETMKNERSLSAIAEAWDDGDEI